MHSMAIRDLKNNPSEMTKHLENGESVFVTKHGKPVGITMPLGDDLLSQGIIKAVAVEQYRLGLISMGKMAELLQISKADAMKLLNDLHIDWLDYTEEELDDQMRVAQKIHR